MFRPLVHSAAAIGVALALLAASLIFFLNMGAAAPGVTGDEEAAGSPATLTPTPGLCGGCAMSPEIVAVNGVPVPVDGNDDFDDAIEIASLPYAATQNTFGATTEPGEPSNPNGCISFFPQIKGATVWYRYTPPANTTITADTFIESGGFDTVLAVYTGAAVNALTPVACNDDSGTLQSLVMFPAIGGTTYHFQVGGFDSRTGNLKLTVTSSGGGGATPTPNGTPSAPTGTPKPLPDLVVQSITTSPAKPLSGVPFLVTVTILNQGGDAASTGYVDFYQDLASAPTAFLVGDAFCFTGALAAGAKTTCAQGVTYTAAGSFDMWAQVDTDEFVAEADEANNVFGPIKLVVNQGPTPTSTATPTATSTPTVTPTGVPDPFCGGCAMSLEIVAVDGVPLTTPCNSDSGTFTDPAKCSLAKGDSFTLHIVASSLPAVGSYGAFQTFLGYGTLPYKPASPATEIRWPDGAYPLRSPLDPDGREGFVQHADLGAFPPDSLPISTYTGELVELEMSCRQQSPPGGGQTHMLILLPFSEGRQFGSDGTKAFFQGPSGSQYVTGDIGEAIAVGLPVIGWRPLDLNGDGEFDRRQLPKPTPTFSFNFRRTPTLVTPEFNAGAIIDYPIHALLEVNCADVPTPPVAPPVGGIGLDPDVGALTSAAPASSSDTTLLVGVTALAAVIGALGAAWYATRRRLRSGSSTDAA